MKISSMILIAVSLVALVLFMYGVIADEVFFVVSAVMVSMFGLAFASGVYGFEKYKSS